MEGEKQMSEMFEDCDVDSMIEYYVSRKEKDNEQSYEKDSQVKTWWQKIYAKYIRS